MRPATARQSELTDVAPTRSGEPTPGHDPRLPAHSRQAGLTWAVSDAPPSMALGSNALTETPSAARDRMRSIAGASRTSSVPGLNASPRTPTVSPAMLPRGTVWCIARSGSRRCRWLVLITDRSKLTLAPIPWASCPSVPTSFGKQEPPYPTPAWILVPVLESIARPSLTSSIEAPRESQSAAISLMNEILVARKCVARVLDHLGAGDVRGHDWRVNPGIHPTHHFKGFERRSRLCRLQSGPEIPSRLSPDLHGGTRGWRRT